MLEGWYCRTLASEQAAAAQSGPRREMNIRHTGSDEDRNCSVSNNQMPYRQKCSQLKQKLKLLIHENEFFQDALRSSQRRLLKVTRDRSFLLDRLAQYERVEASSSETDETETSDEYNVRSAIKKRKIEACSNNGIAKPQVRKRKAVPPKLKSAPMPVLNVQRPHNPEEGHMTAEEVERHLQSRQSITALVPERAPPTVPTEMFSNEPSLDSESNDQIFEMSPSNVGEVYLSVDVNAVRSNCYSYN